MDIGLSKSLALEALQEAFHRILPGLEVPVMHDIDELPERWDLWIMVTEGTVDFPLSLVLAVPFRESCDTERWMGDVARALSEELGVRSLADGSSHGPTDAPFWSLIWDRGVPYLGDDSESDSDAPVRIVGPLDIGRFPRRLPEELVACVGTSPTGGGSRGGVSLQTAREQRPWQAEVDLDAGTVRALIGGQFPDLAPFEPVPFGAGFDNAAFVVGEFVFRFPRRQIGAECMEAELLALPRLAGRLPLPVPVPCLVGRPTADFPWHFAAYRKLEGQTACRSRLGVGARLRMAPVLGRFLAALHAEPVAALAAAGLGGDTLGRLDVARRAAQARDRLAQLHEGGWVADPGPHLAHLARAEEARPAAPTRVSVVHGDLYARHLLVNDDENLCGIIDWGDVHLGSPALDLAIAHSFLPPAAHAAFLAAYGGVDELEWRFARFRALYHTLLVAVFAVDTGDDSLRTESLLALSHLAAGRHPDDG